MSDDYGLENSFNRSLTMTRILSISMVALTLLLAWAPGAYASDDGKELYDEYCQGCHGEDKTGLNGYEGSLAAFTDRLEGVTENMPDFAGFFDEDEIAALHAYLMKAQ